MPTPILLALAIPALVALALVAIESLAPRRTWAASPHVALVALSAAFALIWQSFDAWGMVEGLSLVAEPFGHVMQGIWIGLVALSLLVDAPTWQTNAQSRPHRQALQLLAATGGLLSLAAGDLFTVWVGIQLWGVADYYAGDGSKDTMRVLGGVAIYGACALLYASLGTIDLTALSTVLWEWAGPLPAMVYGGLALLVGGLALATDLLPPFGAPRDRGRVVPAVLGIGLLARLSLYTFGALAWEWLWVMVLPGLATLVWGLGGALLSTRAEARLRQLAIAQCGFLLLAVGSLSHTGGVHALLASVLAYGLGQLALKSAWHLSMVARGPGDAKSSFGISTTLSRYAPLVAVVVALLSLAAVPPTLGFHGRVRTYWALRWLGVPWLALVLLGAGMVSITGYVFVGFSLLTHTDDPWQPKAVPVPVAVGLGVCVVGLIALGIRPVILAGLASWIVGG